MTEDGGSAEPDSEHPKESADEQPREYVGLLTEVMTNTLDEDYEHGRRKRGVPRRHAADAGRHPVASSRC